MPLAKWAAPSAEISIAGTALDSRATGTTAFVADVDNTAAADRDLNARLWMQLASITTAAGANVTLELRYKRGATYAANAVEAASVVVPVGASAKDVAVSLRLVGPFVFGLFFTSALGVSTAATGNAIFWQDWNEDVT